MKKLSMLVLLTLSSAAFAAPTAGKERSREIKPTKLTCQEFVGLDETVRPQVVYFLEGVTKSGQTEEAVIAVDQISDPVLWVVDECKKTPKESVWQKVEHWVKSKTKKL